MLTSLTQTGKEFGREIGRAWDNLADAWRDLRQRSGTALTHFKRADDAAPHSDGRHAPFPRWSLLACEVFESADEVLVQVELPGMERNDFSVDFVDNSLLLSGLKRPPAMAGDGAFRLMERAYGRFERRVDLPCEVDASRAQAVLRDGVLSVALPRAGAGGTAVPVL